MSPRALLHRLVTDGLEPHAEAITPIHQAGDIAVVFFDVAPASSAEARSLGWTGRNGVSRLTRENAIVLASHVEAAFPENVSQVEWLRSVHPGKILLFCFNGAVAYVDFDPATGGYAFPLPADILAALEEAS